MGFRLAQMADLARQMSFTPSEQRARQILAAEELGLQIDPAKAYPFDFILFRITGYHPKPSAQNLGEDQLTEGEFTGQLLTGLAIQHDLGLLIETVSETLNQRVDSLNEPVLTIEDVCRQYKVSDKSIQRWRRKGLAGRRFIFPDGKNRVGFLTASVERFFAIYLDQAAREANFSAIDPDEQQRILAMAHRLAEQGCCADEFVQRIARRFNRSPVTICFVCQHDPQTNGALLTGAQPALTDRQRALVDRAFARGISLSLIAQRLGRKKTTVYRALVVHRWERLGAARIKFIDDPLYHEPDAQNAIDAIAAADDLTAAPTDAEQRLPRNLPPYLESFYCQPALSPARERGLFLKLSFHKYQFTTLRNAMRDRAIRRRDLEMLQAHLNQAGAIKNQIVAANLRIVVSVARRHVPASAAAYSALMDLVSDGSVALMRAVDAYDLHRGVRFSSYATFALSKEFARSVFKRRRPAASLSGDLPDRRVAAEAARAVGCEQVREMLAGLEEREQAVLSTHFGLAGRASAVTLNDVARELGLSRECVRKIEQSALAKLRQSAVAQIREE